MNKLIMNDLKMLHICEDSINYQLLLKLEKQHHRMKIFLFFLYNGLSDTLKDAKLSYTRQNEYLGTLYNNESIHLKILQIKG